MDVNPIVLSIPIFMGLIIVELIADWISGKRSYRLGDAFGNIGCGIFEQSTGLLLKIATVGLYTWVYQYRIFEIERTWIHAVLLFVAVDFLYYWAHRISHETNLLWLGHVVHHQSEDYNLSVALRQGALQKIFTAPFYLPLALIGFAPDWFLYIVAWNTLYQFWIHTEKIGKLGPLEWILNTPSHHRVHHGRNAKYIDKNHAASLIIWDRMFGTFQEEEERPTYGITKAVNTFNPITAHIKPIQDLYDESRSMSTGDKLRLLFKSPGWKPKNSSKATIDRPLSEPKYNPSVSGLFFWSLLFSFLLTLAFVAVFLMRLPNWNNYGIAWGILAAALALYCLGYNANGKPSPIWLEVITWPVISAWWISQNMMYVGIVFFLLSGTLRWLQRRSQSLKMEHERI